MVGRMEADGKSDGKPCEDRLSVIVERGGERPEAVRIRATGDHVRNGNGFTPELG